MYQAHKHKHDWGEEQTSNTMAFVKVSSPGFRLTRQRKAVRFSPSPLPPDVPMFRCHAAVLQWTQPFSMRFELWSGS